MSDSEELQLHEDEGRPVSKKRCRNNDAGKKLEAVEWARKNSIKSAAKKFGVDRKSIRGWMRKEQELKQQTSYTSRGSKRKRLDGGGRQVSNPDLDVELARWIREKRENKQLMSRRIITNKANELFRGSDLKISAGVAFDFSHTSFLRNFNLNPEFS